MKIGVLSDTHGHLDPKIAALFDGVNHILHGGDIGYASIILELKNNGLNNPSNSVFGCGGFTCPG